MTDFDQRLVDIQSKMTFKRPQNFESKFKPVSSLLAPFLLRVAPARRLPVLLGGQLDLVSKGAPVEGVLVLRGDERPTADDYSALWRLTRLESGLAHVEVSRSVERGAVHRSDAARSKLLRAKMSYCCQLGSLF